MQPILNISKRGRAATIRCKLFVCVGFTVLLFLVAQIPDYWYVFKNYGFPGLRAPLCSLEAFSRCSDVISILGGILLFEALRLAATAAVAVAVLLLGRWTKNQLITLSVSTGVFLLPILLKLLRIP